MKQNKMREEMKEAFLNALKEEKIPWECDWVRTGRPQNAATGKGYRGINSLWLSYLQEEKGYRDPRWCTFKQANEKGWKIKKGAKGAKVEFWSMYDTETKQKISSRQASELKEQLGDDFYGRVKPVSSVYTVFNAEQIEGIPEVIPEHYTLDEKMLVEKRDVLLKNMGVSFREGEKEAFYNSLEDKIHMPDMGQFRSGYGYMSTFLHEAGHATGHESRLKRPLKNRFGTPEYAREELRAEIASAFVSRELGNLQAEPEHMENHKAYIQDWIDALEKDPNELFAAIRDAEKISDYLMEKGEFGREEVKEALDVGMERAGRILEEKRRELQQETGKDQPQQMKADPELPDSRIGYSVIQDVAEMEIKLNLPSEERMMEGPDDNTSVFKTKSGVKASDLQKRYEEFQNHHMPLLGIQEAAKLRLAARGRDIEGFHPDPVHLQMAQMLREYQDNGMDVKDVIRNRIGEVMERTGQTDLDYVKNAVCSIAAKDRSTYEEYKNIVSNHERELPGMERQDSIFHGDQNDGMPEFFRNRNQKSPVQARAKQIMRGMGR